jgi:hypothetical protein
LPEEPGLEWPRSIGKNRGLFSRPPLSCLPSRPIARPGPIEDRSGGIITDSPPRRNRIAPLLSQFLDVEAIRTTAL